MMSKHLTRTGIPIEVSERIAGVSHSEHQSPMFMGAVVRPEPWQLEGIDIDEAQEVTPQISFFRRYRLFICTFVIPVFFATLYFGWIAAGLYVTETKFIVRTASSGGEATLSNILHSSGMSRAVDETHAVSTYIQSRDIVSFLERNKNLRELMSRSEADFIYKYPNFYSYNNAEQLFRAYLRFIDVDVDSVTGITTLYTKAFRPEDSMNLANNIVQAADTFINRLNDRAHNDSIAYAQTTIKEAKERLSDAERRLAAFRNREMIVDPEKEANASLEMLAKLSTEIVRMEASLAQQLAQTPNSPTIPSIRENIRSLRTEYDKQRSEVAGKTNSMASKLEGFERISLERELAAKALGLAFLELEKARQSAQSERIYLQTIVVPNLPDRPLKPYRMLWILGVSLICLMIFWTIRSLREIALEHHA